MKLKRDYWVGGILILLGIVALVMSMQIKVKTGNSTDPGSRLFPVMASILLMVCGGGVLITAGKSQEKRFLLPKGWGRLLLSFLIMILYTLSLKYIGFVISTPVFLYATVTLLADGQKIAVWKKMLYCGLVTGIFWYLFQEVLSMNLPHGILF